MNDVKPVVIVSTSNDEGPERYEFDFNTRTIRRLEGPETLLDSSSALGTIMDIFTAAPRLIGPQRDGYAGANGSWDGPAVNAPAVATEFLMDVTGWTYADQADNEPGAQ